MSTLSQENLPIVIGNPTYQHQGLGRKVLKALIDLARQRGWKELKVQGNLWISIMPPDDVLSPLDLWKVEVLKKGKACS